MVDGSRTVSNDRTQLVRRGKRMKKTTYDLKKPTKKVGRSSLVGYGTVDFFLNRTINDVDDFSYFFLYRSLTFVCSHVVLGSESSNQSENRKPDANVANEKQSPVCRLHLRNTLCRSGLISDSLNQSKNHATLEWLRNTTSGLLR